MFLSTDVLIYPAILVEILCIIAKAVDSSPCELYPVLIASHKVHAYCATTPTQWRLACHSSCWQYFLMRRICAPRERPPTATCRDLWVGGGRQRHGQGDKREKREWLVTFEWWLRWCAEPYFKCVGNERAWLTGSKGINRGVGGELSLTFKE